MTRYNPQAGFIQIQETSVAVPARDILVAVDIQASRAEKRVTVTVSILFAFVAVWFVFQAWKVDTGPDALMPDRLVMLIIGAALSVAAAVTGLRSAFRAPSVEVTTSLLRLPGPFRLWSTVLSRADITEANITTVKGYRSLVLATPSRRAVLPQCQFRREDWDRLVQMVGADDR
jgi:hypothetical protein